MLIDWFTVGAQVLNFIILLWLLKRFLYAPILKAIDAREQRIAEELKDAETKQSEAQKEREEFEHKNAAFDQQRAELLSKTTTEIEAQGRAMLEKAREAADSWAEKRQEALRTEADGLGQAIEESARNEVLAITRKALHDLATTDLESSMVEIFTQRLGALDGQAKADLVVALKTASTPPTVSSAFALPPGEQAAIQKVLHESFSCDAPLRFEIRPDLVCGIELSANGQLVAWNVDDYLLSLKKEIGRIASERGTQASAATVPPSPQDSSPSKSKPGTDSDVADKPSDRRCPACSGQPRMTVQPTDLQETVERAIRDIGEARKGFSPQLKAQEIGTITRISTGIARVSGLPHVGSDELLRFSGDVFGIAFNLDEDDIGVVLLGDYANLRAGDRVERTGRVMDVPVGEGLLGRVIDPLGRPLDDKGSLVSSARLPIERPAAAIMDRAPVSVPLQTGLKVIDALIPVGRGQRELILGDRRTGKSAIAIDAILNQQGRDVVCVYCAIGQRASAVAKAVANLREKGAMAYTIVVVAEGNQAPGLAYVAPYAATSIAEHFMEAGRDVLIVYDDLTHHARAYRELSLLLRRPPGREAFPGDIFYLHSRLLERATHLSEARGGGSLTALPIIETEAQNISAYIPTNLISITDGQIYLSPTLFELGVLPAVDVGKSVSRVGGKAQWTSFRAAAGDLKLAYAQFEERETFSRFGAQLDADARAIIEHGKRIRACLSQSESSPVSVAAQIMILLALSARLFDNVPLERMGEAQQALQNAAATLPAAVAKRLESAEKFSDEDHASILGIARKALSAFAPTEVPAAGETQQTIEPGNPPEAVTDKPPLKLPTNSDTSPTSPKLDANAGTNAGQKSSDQTKRSTP